MSRLLRLLWVHGRCTVAVVVPQVCQGPAMEVHWLEAGCCCLPPPVDRAPRPPAASPPQTPPTAPSQPPRSCRQPDRPLWYSGSAPGSQRPGGRCLLGSCLVPAGLGLCLLPPCVHRPGAGVGLLVGWREEAGAGCRHPQRKSGVPRQRPPPPAPPCPCRAARPRQPAGGAAPAAGARWWRRRAGSPRLTACCCWPPGRCARCRGPARSRCAPPAWRWRLAGGA
mmetsp:Transcript_15574/g.38763  ORF Transcript_15574/g.38763 Transcript_15574/m.38763 type:complete len:224 (+) Transcript_15574:429-1100(+)